MRITRRLRKGSTGDGRGAGATPVSHLAAPPVRDLCRLDADGPPIDEVAQRIIDVVHFPSQEVIASTRACGRCWAQDGSGVGQGACHVLRSSLRQVAGVELETTGAGPNCARPKTSGE